MQGSHFENLRGIILNENTKLSNHFFILYYLECLKQGEMPKI